MKTAKPFKCQHCQSTLSERRGNELVTEVFQMEIKRTDRITCRNCGKQTRFPVTAQGKNVDKLVQKT